MLGRWDFRHLIIAITAGVVVGLLVATLFGQTAVDRKPVLTGLQAPRGLAILGDGSLLIAEVLGGRLLRFDPNGNLSVVTSGLPATYGGPAERYPIGVSAAVYMDTFFYYVVGEFRGSRYSTIYRLGESAIPEPLAGGVGRDGFPSTRLVNPYDIVAVPNGGLFVSDSGSNAVLRISKNGNISEYATFPQREVATPDGERFIDVVPTGLTLGPDGALFLSSFAGYPYPKGAAYIYRLEDVNKDGDAQDVGEITVFAEGFSSATDLVFADDGALLVAEFSTDMPALLGDLGPRTAAEIPGRLLRHKNGVTEVVSEGLVSPTSVVTVEGRIFVSEEFAGNVIEINPVSENPVSKAGIPVAVGLAASASTACMFWGYYRVRPRWAKRFRGEGYRRT